MREKFKKAAREALAYAGLFAFDVLFLLWAFRYAYGAGRW